MWMTFVAEFAAGWRSRSKTKYIGWKIAPLTLLLQCTPDVRGEKFEDTDLWGGDYTECVKSSVSWPLKRSCELALLETRLLGWWSGCRD